jgi:ABC-type transporter Mla subunit MlaD
MGKAFQAFRRIGDPFHYRHRDFFVGLFLFTAIAVVLGLLAITLIKNDVMEHWVFLSVQYENVYGLQKGAAVNFQGVEIGAVDDIALNEDGYVDVSIKIRHRYFPYISKGCVAGLGQKNFVVGDWQINLIKSKTAFALQPGARLASVPAIPLDNAVEKLTRMVSVVDTLFNGVQAGQGVIGHLFKQDTLIDQIQLFAGQISQLLTEVDRTVTRADGMIAELNSFGTHGIAAVDSIATLARGANALMDKLDTVVSGIDTLSRSLQGLPGGVDTLLSGMQRDVREAEVLLRGVQKHWLFRRSVEKARREQQAGPPAE